MDKNLNTKQNGDLEAVERLDCETSEDSLQILMHQQRYDFALARMSPQDSVLEIGTGTGYFSKILATHCKHYSGIEFDPEACDITRQRLQGRGILLQGDAQSLPFQNQSFSSVVCLEVLEHLPDYRKAVGEIHRCLAPNGRAIISVPYRWFGGKNDLNPFHLYEPGARELTGVFGRYFTCVEPAYQYFSETPVMTIARLLHVRRFLGLTNIYRDLADGAPPALARITIDGRGHGIRLGFLLVASLPRPNNQA